MLHYEVTGSGPPVVLLHEGIVDSRSWGKVVPLLAPHHTVVTYDQRGYGRSPRPDGPYSLTRRPRLGARRGRRSTGRRSVGTSRGGRIAIDFTLSQPERVTALVTVASAMSGHRLELDVPERIERGWEEAEARGDFAALADLDLEIWAPLGVDPQLRQMTVDNARMVECRRPGALGRAAGSGPAGRDPRSHARDHRRARRSADRRDRRRARYGGSRVPVAP